MYILHVAKFAIRNQSGIRRAHLMPRAFFAAMTSCAERKHRIRVYSVACIADAILQTISMVKKGMRVW